MATGMAVLTLILTASAAHADTAVLAQAGSVEEVLVIDRCHGTAIPAGTI